VSPRSLATWAMAKSALAYSSVSDALSKPVSATPATPPKCSPAGPASTSSSYAASNATASRRWNSRRDSESAEPLDVVRGLLREGGFWCRLEADGGFVHIGWDYYMYVGAIADVTGIVPAVEALGLYIESGWTSPYHPEEE